MAGAPPEGLIYLLKVLDTSNLTVSSARAAPPPPPSASDHTSPPQVPDELTSNLLARSGAVCADERAVRLVSLAAQKFLSDVIEDAREGAANRAQAPLAVQKTEGFARQQDKEKDRRATLLTEDVARALQKVRTGVVLRICCASALTLPPPPHPPCSMASPHSPRHTTSIGDSSLPSLSFYRVCSFLDMTCTAPYPSTNVTPAERMLSPPHCAAIRRARTASSPFSSNHALIFAWVSGEMPLAVMLDPDSKEK